MILSNTQDSTCKVFNITHKLQALSQYEIPLPPSAEQDEIADKIQQNFLIIERIESELQKFTKQSEVLRQSILRDAFMGRLVPQNPADEPAERILERIKAERLTNKSKNNQLELSQYVK
jgi:type I restriction enzyme S subunit